LNGDPLKGLEFYQKRVLLSLLIKSTGQLVRKWGWFSGKIQFLTASQNPV
jgi:hypothetical protein